MTVLSAPFMTYLIGVFVLILLCAAIALTIGTVGAAWRRDR